MTRQVMENFRKFFFYW